MSVQAQLEYEARSRYRQSALAVVAGVLVLAAAIMQLTGVHTKVEELTLDLITEHKRYPLDLIGSIINSIGLLALAATLNYLYGITKARNPEAPPYIRWLAIAGAVTSAVVAVAYAAEVAAKAHDFVSAGTQTYQQADALTSGTLFTALPLLGELASLLLTVGFIWTSLNAMRAGLLTRFLGYLGIFAGVLVLIPIGSPVPVVESFWLLSLAYLFTGRWPYGLPKAWVSGEMERWPTSAEQRAARGDALTGGARGGGRQSARPEKVRAPKATVVAAKDDDEPSVSRTRADTPKRKRKRRH